MLKLLTVPAILIACSPSTAAVSVLAEVEVTGEYISLGNLVGDGSSLPNGLGEVRICPSPLPGRVRSITRGQILVALRRADIPDDACDLECPEQVKVTRASTEVPGQTLFEAARDFALAGLPEEWNVRVEPVRLPPDLTAPAGALEVRVGHTASGARKGQNTLPVEIVVDGTVYRTIHVSVTVRAFAHVAVARRAIPRGEELTPENTEVRECEITALTDDLLTECPSAGTIAGMSISQGSPICSRWVLEPPAVRFGDVVFVIVQNGAVRVVDKGTAVQNGHKGQRIKVRLQTNSRLISGTVAGPGTVNILVRK